MPFANIGAARDAILGHFKDGWATAYPVNAPPVIYADTALDTPATEAPWVRVRVMHTLGFQATMNTAGNRRFRSFGKVQVEVRNPQGDGLTGNDTMVNNVQAIFEGKNVGGTDGVIFREVTPGEVGPDGTWFLTTVSVKFEYDRMR